MRLTWREKMGRPAKPEIVKVTPKMQQRFGKGKILIPTPRLIDAVVRKVPKGRLVTLGQIREYLAKKFKVNSTCPLTTGIFLRVVSETAEEERIAGKKWITPYWRVIRDDGSLNEKFPGGVASQAKKLKQEGFQIENGASRERLQKGRGKKVKVSNFETKLVRNLTAVRQVW